MTGPSFPAGRPGSALSWLDELGALGIRTAAQSADLLYLLANSCGGFFTFRTGAWRYLRQLTLEQVYFTAVQVLILITGVGAMLGILAMLPLFAFHLTEVGLLADIMSIVVFHQLTPLVVALVVIGRSGTAITAELGELQANQTIETLITLGIEPHQFLVLPRLLGVVTSLLILTFWANLGAVIGAGLYSLFYADIPLQAFVLATLTRLTLLETGAGIALVLVFGVVIALVHSNFGMNAHSQLDIARQLPRTFIVSASICVLATVIVSAVLHA